MRVAERVADHHLSIALPYLTGDVVQIEGAGRQVFLFDQESIAIDVNRGWSGQNAGNILARKADEIGVEREVLGDTKAAEYSSAAEDAGRDEGIAGHDAPHIRLIVVGVVGESARDGIDAIACEQAAIEETALIAYAAL